MHNHGTDQKVVLKDPAAPSPTLTLVGNPNVGKSVIFSHLTGKYVTVSNYPGTTVEISRGSSSFDGGSHPLGKLLPIPADFAGFARACWPITAPARSVITWGIGSAS